MECLISFLGNFLCLGDDSNFIYIKKDIFINSFYRYFVYKKYLF